MHLRFFFAYLLSAIFALSLFAQSTVPDSTNNAFIIKASLFSLFEGDIPLYIEKKVHPQLSFELGAGITTKAHFSDLLDPNNNNYYSGNKSATAGLSFSSSVRYYTTPKSIFGGTYFAPTYRLRSHNIKTPVCDNLLNKTTYKNEHLRRHDFFMQMGFQNHLSQKIVLDIFIGSGIRLSRYHKLFCEYDGNSYQSFHALQQATTFYFTTGIKIGFVL
jgi:hypothetical protein